MFGGRRPVLSVRHGQCDVLGADDLKGELEHLSRSEGERATARRVIGPGIRARCRAATRSGRIECDSLSGDRRRGAEREGRSGAGAATSAVGAELADVEPPEFVAVTMERMVWPTSPDASV